MSSFQQKIEMVSNNTKKLEQSWLQKKMWWTHLVLNPVYLVCTRGHNDLIGQSARVVGTSFDSSLSVMRISRGTLLTRESLQNSSNERVTPQNNRIRTADILMIENASQMIYVDCRSWWYFWCRFVNNGST